MSSIPVHRCAANTVRAPLTTVFMTRQMNIVSVFGHDYTMMLQTASDGSIPPVLTLWHTEHMMIMLVTVPFKYVQQPLEPCSCQITTEAV